MWNAAKIPRTILILGILVYLLCLWRASPQLADKGYFLSVLVLGMFAIVAYRQPTADTVWFVVLCRLVLLLASGLMLVGVWNMPLTIVHKGIYAAAWFACMYGASACSIKPGSRLAD